MELLVAMAILVTISASTFLVFRGVTRAWRSGELRTERYQQARLLFDVFERELSSCLSSPRYPFVGLRASDASPLHDGSAVGDEVMFVGRLPGRTGLIERGYWLDTGQRLMCHDDESGDGDYATGTSELCGQEISAFSVAHFDGTAWLDRWDADPQGRLPKAVRIAVTMAGEPPEQFETIISIPSS